MLSFFDNYNYDINIKDSFISNFMNNKVKITLFFLIRFPSSYLMI